MKIMTQPMTSTVGPPKKSTNIALKQMNKASEEGI